MAEYTALRTGQDSGASKGVRTYPSPKSQLERNEAFLKKLLGSWRRKATLRTVLVR